VLSYQKTQKIDAITTRNHAHFVDKWIRTCNSMLREKINDDIKGGVNAQWHNYIFPIMLTYNNKNEHAAAKMTPG